MICVWVCVWVFECQPKKPYDEMWDFNSIYVIFCALCSSAPHPNSCVYCVLYKYPFRCYRDKEVLFPFAIHSTFCFSIFSIIRSSCKWRRRIWHSFVLLNVCDFPFLFFYLFFSLWVGCFGRFLCCCCCPWKSTLVFCSVANYVYTWYIGTTTINHNNNNNFLVGSVSAAQNERGAERSFATTKRYDK